MRLIRGLSGQPLWYQIWMAWLALVNVLAAAFVGREGAEWVFYGFIGVAFSRFALAEVNGYNRLLGLGHVVFWTPLLIYILGWRWEALSAGGVYGSWLAIVVATNAIALGAGYLNVYRYVTGDRRSVA